MDNSVYLPKASEEFHMLNTDLLIIYLQDFFFLLLSKTVLYAQDDLL